MITVKICGIRSSEHGLAAARSGADLIGLILAPSRRRIEPELAAEISQSVKTTSSVKVVGVFVNETVKRMNELVRLCGLDYVQLSGDEPDDVIPTIDAPVVRVVHVFPETSSEQLNARIDAVPSDLVLLDTARAGTYGGTGEPFDWGRVPPLRRPVLLAGGLNPGNVRCAIESVRPWGVDVSGGVERDGVKDESLIADFIAQAKHRPTNVDLVP